MPPSRSDNELPDDQLRELLARELAPLVDEPVEHILIWDRAGRELAHAIGDETSVRLPPGDWSGAVIAHTHPANLDPQLMGLDPDDLAVLARQQPDMGALVYRWNDRDYLQTLTAAGGEWPEDTVVRRELAFEFVRARAEQRQGILSPGDDSMHIALERMAKRLRLSYRRTEVQR